MKVCDKCKKSKDVKKATINGKDFELCASCSKEITDWIKKKESKNTLQNLFKQ
jgi:hypothetical protein